MPRRILVGVDFSSCSLHALEAANALALELGAELDVVHAWEPPTPPPVLANESANLMTAGPDSYRPLYDPSAEITEARAQTEQLLARHRVKASRIYVEAGAPARTIIDLARKGGYEFIVVGTHGRGGFVRLLLGSIAEQVVRHAHCPVLTIPMPESSRPRRASSREAARI